MRIFALIASAVLAAILTSGCTVQVNTTPTTSAAPPTSTVVATTTQPPDDLMSLLHGVPVAEPEARHLMEMVCTTFILHPGTPISAVAKELSARQSWTPVQADQFIRAAVAVACPRFVNGS
jgi:hypothetical protein